MPNGLSFSRETLQTTLDNLTVPVAIRMIALGGSRGDLLALLGGLTRNFGATMQDSTLRVINEASKRFHAAPRNAQVSYRHE